MIASFSALGVDLPSIALIVLHSFVGSVVVVVVCLIRSVVKSFKVPDVEVAAARMIMSQR